MATMATTTPGNIVAASGRPQPLGTQFVRASELRQTCDRLVHQLYQRAQASRKMRVEPRTLRALAYLMQNQLERDAIERLRLKQPSKPVNIMHVHERNDLLAVYFVDARGLTLPECTYSLLTLVPSAADPEPVRSVFDRSRRY